MANDMGLRCSAYLPIAQALPIIKNNVLQLRMQDRRNTASMDSEYE